MKCNYCKRNLVAGAYPEWFCLQTNCKNYLKPIINGNTKRKQQHQISSTQN
jgi:hypothetical protein